MKLTLGKHILLFIEASLKPRDAYEIIALVI